MVALIHFIGRKITDTSAHFRGAPKKHTAGKQNHVTVSKPQTETRFFRYDIFKKLKFESHFRSLITP